MKVKLHPIIIIGGLTLLGGLLRFYHLGYKSLWFDEAGLYWIARGRDIMEIISLNAAGNSAPPLFPLLVNLISKIGDSEAILRSISFLAGTAAIPAVYFLCKQFLHRYTAYFCAFLVAISSSQVMYSQELREYSVAFLLATLILLFFNRFLREQNYKNLLYLALASIIGIFSQYGLALLILALNLIVAVELFFINDKKKLLTGWAAIQFLVLCAAIVTYQLSLRHQMESGFGAGYLANAYWDGSLGSLIKLATVNTYQFFAFASSASGLFCFIFFIGFLNELKKRSDRTALMLLIFPMVITFIAACARLYPYLGRRQDIFLVPMIYVFAGFGFEFLSKLDLVQTRCLPKADNASGQGKKRIIILPLVLILGFVGLYRTGEYLKDPGFQHIRPVIKTLSASFEPKDRMYIYYGANPAFRYYYRKNMDRRIYGVRSIEKPEKYLTQLDEALSKQGRIWMVFSHCHPNEPELITQHTSKYRKVKLVSTSPGAFLYLAD
ncbi:glycosyltransferase family 39 protein [Candidatus Omnitrophota bacterium]